MSTNDFLLINLDPAQKTSSSVTLSDRRMPISNYLLNKFLHKNASGTKESQSAGGSVK